MLGAAGSSLTSALAGEFGLVDAQVPVLEDAPEEWGAQGSSSAHDASAGADGAESAGGGGGGAEAAGGTPLAVSGGAGVLSDVHSGADERALGVRWAAVPHTGGLGDGALLPVVSVDAGAGLACHLLSGDVLWASRGERLRCARATSLLGGDLCIATEGVLDATLGAALARLDCTMRRRLGGHAQEAPQRTTATALVTLADAVEYLEEIGEEGAAAALREFAAAAATTSAAAAGAMA